MDQISRDILTRWHAEHLIREAACRDRANAETGRRRTLTLKQADMHKDAAAHCVQRLAG